ncbi:hypothetical protein [Microbulbifer aestuariivivens]|uniref:hypothetical protein n=1 Tax=Microbulbifer aestuariivivens TaxID=1908308 RepID=UPI0031E8485A
MSNLVKKAVFSGLIVLALALSYTAIGGFTGMDGYLLQTGRTDNLYIHKDNVKIIKSTIIDFSHTEGFIVGLRMPAENLSCDDGDGYKIRLINKKVYFVLNTDSGEAFEFESKELFDSKLKELALDYSPDFTKYDEVWQRYSGYYKNTDFSSCVQID